MPSIRKVQHPKWLGKQIRKESKNKHIYASTRWTKLSRNFRKKYPLCSMCRDRGIINEAKEVDHVVPINLGGAIWDWANLQGLCRRHHRLKTMNDKKKYGS